MSLVSYPYAISVIKVHEESLIDKTQWVRLWEAGIGESYKLLHDMGYGKNAEDQNDIDALTQANVASARELVREVSPEPALTDLLLLPTDAHNIKCMLKSMMEGEDVSSILLEGGSIPLDILNQAFEKDDYEAFPKKLREAVEAFDPDESARVLSAKIDDAVFEQVDLVLSNRKTKNKLLKDYYTLKTDLTNVISVFRVRRLGWNEEQLKALIIPGGEIREQTLLKGVSASEETLPELLAEGSHSFWLKGALRDYEVKKDLPALDFAFATKLYQIIHAAYMDSTGLGPLLNYIVQKDYEARILRVLFQAKRSGKSLPLSEFGIA